MQETQHTEPEYREGETQQEYEERMRAHLEEVEASEPDDFQYTPDQQTAVDRIKSWWNESRSPILTMGGLAGTGKTTVAGRLANELGVGIDALAPTGKAAQRLTQKGIVAETIHSYIYAFEGKSRIEDSRSGATREILHFGNKEDGREGEADLVVCDEASMVSGDVYEDMYRTIVEDGGARILFIGDHGQLEPVGRNPGLMNRPDIRLETIMRQSAENPILSLAHRVRQEAGLRANLDLVDGDRLRIVGKAGSERCAEYAIEAGIDQIIVPFHRMRKSINAWMRDKLGHKGPLAKGDRVVARANNRKQHIYNGNQFEIVTDPIPDASYSSEIGDTRFVASVKSVDDGRVWEDMSLFLPGPDGSWNDNCHKMSNIAIDYAYAITCHVAQGSEWDNVLVVYAPCRAWSNERWLYTAVTRAAKKLTLMAG